MQRYSVQVDGVEYGRFYSVLAAWQLADQLHNTGAAARVVCLW